ncbi:hypothetical protein ZOSMA_88G00220 [Zostera marina]|uniref:Uncharacterized protein n=1 Tax=Zostera marina TaxID=29655 RepID=A0A0K9NKB5_ZOSMR|nr:hypothetical protein ZOSMA_88G00220 [Zostera marina]
MPPYSPSSVLPSDGQGESPFSSPVPPPSLSVHDVDDRFDPIGLPTFWEDIEEVRGLSDDGVRQEEGKIFVIFFQIARNKFLTSAINREK